MEPLSNAAGSLATLNNAISNGTAGQAPTPPQPIATPQPQFATPQQAPQPMHTPLPQTPAQHAYIPQPQMPTPQAPLAAKKSPVLPIIIALLVLIILVLGGLLYIYGAKLSEMQKQQTESTQTGAQQVPANGFQVTESSVMEPNFDAQQGIEGNTNTDINSDVNNMFE